VCICKLLKLKGGNILRSTHKTNLLSVLFVSCLLVISGSAFAQQNPEGFYILDDGSTLVNRPTTSGHVSTVGAAQPFFSDIFFGFDIARDIELVQNETGLITGYYLLDGFGGQHEVGTVPAYDVDRKPYFAWDIARDLEIVNTYKLITDAITKEVVGSQVTGQIGYYVTDGWGGIHPVNDTIDLPFRRQDPANAMFKVFHDVPSAYPAPYNYPYFLGFDIVKDMEVSYLFSLVTGAGGEASVIGQTNGYYLLDGFGGVHNAREDLNGQPLEAEWNNVVGRPYFGWDIARDLEITPRGDGYYLLDGYGGMHTVNASLSFGAGVPSTPPYFGFDIAKDMETVQGINGAVLGYYVLDGLGVIHTLGNAPDLGQLVNVPGPLDIFRDLEVSPLYSPVTPAK